MKYLLSVLLVSVVPITVGHSSVGYSKLLTRHEETRSEYDYVIIGGGTAGLTLADRLTEDGKFTVLVIEYGEFDNSTSVTTVAGGAQGLFNTTHLFSFPSTPQPGINSRTTNVTVGKLLGGSSGVNGMVFHRGQKKDYDGWAKFFGGKSDWDWEGLLPYFKKAFTFTPPPESLAKELNIKTDKRFWGKTGTRIFGTFPTFGWPMWKTEMEAFGDFPGVEYPPDSGSGRPGIFYFPSTYDPVSVTRSFSRTGHWDGIVRPNYETILGTKVTRIIFDSKIARAVEYVPATARSSTPANTKIVKARKEIILSAGAIHSPQILQYSGIGPKSLLKSANIPLKFDLPGVGQNFQDHPFNPGHSFVFDKFDIHPSPSDFINNSSWAEEVFEKNKTGPLAIASGNAGAFLPFSVIAPDTYEDIVKAYESEDPAAYLPQGTHPTIVAGYKTQQSALASILRSQDSGTYNVMLRGANAEGGNVDLHPVSRGSVNINPLSPIFSEPVVDYRIFSNPTDMAVLIEFMRFTRRYYAGPTMAKFQPRETAPGLNVTSSEGLAAFIRNVVWSSTFHPVGTCSMLPIELGGVVGVDLRVYGVERLRVVDASVMPMLPGAYTQQSTYVIAEKGADLIKASANEY